MNRLHLRAFEFNAAMVLEEMVGVITSMKGKVLSPEKDNENEISNRNGDDTVIIKTRFGRYNYISYVLGDEKYYLEIDDNIFFPWKYVKTPVVNGTCSKDAYLEEMSDTDLTDKVLNDYKNLPVNTAKEIAKEVIKELESKPECGIYREGKRTRVPNTYNDGYHYETVYRKERREKV